MAKQLHNNTIEYDHAVLVSIGNDLQELENLCDSCNIKTVACAYQQVKEVDVRYYIGSGKVQEIKELAQKFNATVIVFDVELSGSKVRNLEEAIGLPVLDRSKIILDIFAQRAQSAEGKLQVELAQLKYNLPRLIGSSGIMAKMKNSVGMRGPGEKKLELDKRKIRDEIVALEKQIAKLRSQRYLANKQAYKSTKPRVCLVGYTNSGKSTLMNTLAKADVLAKDMLFATLDPKTANVYIDGMQILLTDTVGFIDRLPHEFINAFESTLDSVRDADLLLHVIDASNLNYGMQFDTVNRTIMAIGAGHISTLLVYNKIDKARNQIMPNNELYNNVSISAKENIGIDKLKQTIIEILS